MDCIPKGDTVRSHKHIVPPFGSSINRNVCSFFDELLFLYPKLKGGTLMALIQCPECGSQVSDKALSCPRCGYPMSSAEKPRKSPKTSVKRHPKLPNGFGSIKKLSGNRTNPYAVYPPVTEFDLNGNPVQPKALAYVDNWYKAFGVLSAWKGGNFKPGDAIEIRLPQSHWL